MYPLITTQRSSIRTHSDAQLITFFSWLYIWYILPSNGTPTAQVHDFPQRLLWLLHFLVSQFAWNHSRSWRRKVPGLGNRPEIILRMLLRWSYDKIPPADPLVFHGFHNSNTHCHNSFSCWTHLPLLESNDRKLFVANNNTDITRIYGCWIKWYGGVTYI